MADNTTSLTNALGKTTDWIELYNVSDAPVDLASWHLTDDRDVLTKWTFPATNIPPHGFLLVFASGSDSPILAGQLHASFKLDADGEYLGLVGPNGVTVSHEYSPAFPAQDRDVSYGIGSGNEFRYFSVSTPGATNDIGFVKVADPVFSHPRGFYSNAFDLIVTSCTSQAVVRYTTDATWPSPTNGMIYDGPIPVTNLTCLRAVAYRNEAGFGESDVVTHTYLFLDDVVRMPDFPSGYPGTWSGYVADYGMEADPADLALVAGDAGYTAEEAREAIKNSLLTLPAMSLVIAPDDMFGADHGLYANTAGEGVEWERATSVELIHPDGSRGFQVNAGLRMMGFTSRYPDRNPKHSLRLIFRSTYGAAKLEYPLFEDSGVDEFNTIALRSNSQDSWVYSQYWCRYYAQWVRDSWTHKIQKAMGQPSRYETWVHLYINGMYWGIYNPSERPDAEFAASHFGGSAEDYDVIKTHEELVSGTNTDHKALEAIIQVDPDRWSLGYRDLSADAEYQRVKALLDVTNLADYIIHNTYAASLDWPGNYYMLRNRVTGMGFIFIDWDSEHNFKTIRNPPGGFHVYKNRTLPNTGYSSDELSPQKFHQALLSNAEYRLMFADRVHRAFFNGGPLYVDPANPLWDPDHPERNMPARHWMELAAGIEPALMAEAARWGDYRRDVHPYNEGPYALYTRDNQYMAVRENLLVNWFPLRSAIQVTHFRLAGLYPAIPAPVFSQHGGLYTNGFLLSITASNSIYYTTDGSDPREYGTGQIRGNAYTGPISLPFSVRVKARAVDTSGGNNVWSALSEAVFTCDEPPRLRITELMYNPPAPSGTETNASSAENNIEFVELMNSGSREVGLAGVRFTDGIAFDFSSCGTSSVGPGERFLLVGNMSAFTNRYDPAGIRILGEFSGRLDNSGERIRVVDGVGRTNSVFRYNDARGWPCAADGAGHSLVPLVTDDQADGRLDYGGNWRASAHIGGSPGAADPEPANSILLNEIVAHTDYTNAANPEYDSNDMIELHNAAAHPITLDHWYLSDRQNDLKRWRIPETNVMAAGSWLAFDEVTGFHSPLTNGFGMDKSGEQLFLSYLPGDGTDRVADCVRFKGQENGVSLGRFPDGVGHWFALAPTPGAANDPPSPRPVVSELMFHPPDGDGGADNTELEFIEIYNPRTVTAELWNAEGTWRIDGAVAFTFPAHTALEPNERLAILSFDPGNDDARSRFLSAYGLSEEDVRLLGPYDGRLSNRGERVALEKPLAPDLPNQPLVWVIVDETIYFDRAPWTTAADGTGRALCRINPLLSGIAPQNWYAAHKPTPGAAQTERVIVTDPEDGSAVFAPGPQDLYAVVDSILASNPVERVAFFQDDAVLDADMSAPYTCAWNIPGPGRYTLHAEVTDAAGIWTSRAVRVSALAVSNVAAESVTDCSADLHTVISGDQPADIRIYWGRTDGGTNPASWENTALSGTFSNTACVMAVDGLEPDTLYHARATARVGFATSWSPQSRQFITAGYDAWPYTARIRFDGYDSATPLQNFPALVLLGPHMDGFTYAQFGPSGSSLRFTDDAGTQRLNHQIASWDTNGASSAWVQIPLLTNGTAVRAYWGLDSNTNPPSFTTDGSVWSEGYEAVWHFDGDLSDARAHGHTAVNHGSTADSGIVGGGRLFDGAGTYVDPTIAESWYGDRMGALTVTLWTKPTPSPAADATVFGAAGDTAALHLTMQTSPRLLRWAYGVGGQVLGGSHYDTAAWQMLALVISNGTVYAQKNGEALAAVGNAAAFSPTNRPLIGKRGGAAYPFSGAVDEVRLAPVARSAAWLQAEYRTVADPLGLATYEPVRHVDGSFDADGDGLPDAWERAHFTDTARTGSADWDHDGMLDGDEYIAGTDPTNAASLFRAAIAHGGGTPEITIRLVPAQGTGYEGVARYYDLWSAPVPGASPWQPVPDFTNILGEDRLLIFTNPGTPAQSGFFLPRVRLDPVP